MELKTAQITSNQIVCHSDTQITLENDMNVPDSKPDIDKIIKIETILFQYIIFPEV